MVAGEFIKLLPHFLRLFGSKNQQASNLELLAKYENHYPDKDELSRQVRAQINSKLYGKGKFIPDEYLALAKSSKNPELILSLFFDVSNFLNYPPDGGVALRRDLKNNEDRKKFKKITDSIWTIGTTAIILLIALTFSGEVLNELTNLGPPQGSSKQKLAAMLNISTTIWPLLFAIFFTTASFRINQKLESLDQLIFSAPQLQSNA